MNSTPLSSSSNLANEWRRYQVVRQLVATPPIRCLKVKDYIMEYRNEEHELSEEKGGVLVDVCGAKIKIPLRSTIVFAPDVRNCVNHFNDDCTHESSSRGKEGENKNTAVEHEHNEARRRGSADWSGKVATHGKGNSLCLDSSDSFNTNLSTEDFCPGESVPLRGSSVGGTYFADVSHGPGTSEEAATFLSSTLREKLLTDIPPLLTARRSTASLRRRSVHPNECEMREENLFVIDAPSPSERAQNAPGSAWFWEGYRAALYGHQVFFHLRGTGVNWRDDGLLPQALLRQPPYLLHALKPYAVEVEGEGAKFKAGVECNSSSSSSAFLATSSVCSRAALFSSFLQLTSCKLDILSGILSSVLTHLLHQPLLEAHEGPSALLLCATKDECEECYTLLSSWAAPFHLLVHNAWDPLPPFTLRLLSSSSSSSSTGGGSAYPTAGTDGGKVTDIVIATPPLWEHLASSRSTFASGQTYQRLCGLPCLNKVGKGVRRRRREEEWKCKRGGWPDASSSSYCASPSSVSSSSSSLCSRMCDVYSCIPVSFFTENLLDDETSSLLFPSSVEKPIPRTEDTANRTPNTAVQASASTTEAYSLLERECVAVIDEKEKKECWEEMLIVLERLSRAVETSGRVENADGEAHLPPPLGVRRVEASHSRGGPKKHQKSQDKKTMDEGNRRIPSSTPPAPLYHPFVRTPYSPLIRPYQLTFVTQLALINVNAQLAMGYGPLLERIFLRRDGVDADEHDRKVERQDTKKEETLLHRPDWRGEERKRKRTASPSLRWSASTTPTPFDAREKAQEMMDWLPEDVQWYAIDGDPTVGTASLFPPAPRESGITETMPLPSCHRGRSECEGEAPVAPTAADLLAVSDDGAVGKNEEEEGVLHEGEVIRREHHHFVHTVLQRHWGGGGGMSPETPAKAADENEARAGETRRHHTPEETQEKRLWTSISVERYGVAHIHLAPAAPPSASPSWRRRREPTTNGETEENGRAPQDGVRVAEKKGKTEGPEGEGGYYAFDTQGSTPVQRVEGLLFLHGITAASVYLDPSVFVDLLEGVKKEVLQFWEAFGPWTTDGMLGLDSSTSRPSRSDPVLEKEHHNSAANLLAMHPEHFFTFRLAFLQENMETAAEVEHLARSGENFPRTAWLDHMGVLLTPHLLLTSPSLPFSHLFFSRWGLLLSHLEEKMNGVMFDGHVLQTERVALRKGKAGKESPTPSPSPQPVGVTPIPSEDGVRSVSSDGVSTHHRSSTSSFPLWSWCVPSSTFPVTTQSGASDTLERSSAALPPTPHPTRVDAMAYHERAPSTSPALSWSHFQTALWQCVLERLSPMLERGTNASLSFYSPFPAFLFPTPHGKADSHPPSGEATTLSPVVERKEGRQKDEMLEEEEWPGQKERARLNAYRWMIGSMKAFPSAFSKRVVEMESLRKKQKKNTHQVDRSMHAEESEEETCASSYSVDGHAANGLVYCAFPYLCVALSGTSAAPPSVRDGRLSSSAVPLALLPPAPLFSVVVIRHLFPGFCKETFASMTTSILCQAFADMAVTPPSSSLVPQKADLHATSPSLVPPSSPPLPALSVCIEECCKIGRVLSYYCFEDGKTKRRTRREGEGGTDHEWGKGCRCFYHQAEKEAERSSPPSFSLSVFIEFERTEAAVEAVRLFQRQLQEVQQREQDQKGDPQQDAHSMQDKHEEFPPREDVAEGKVRSQPTPPSPACPTPYYCLFPTVQLFRNEDYYKGVAEEEKQLQSTIQKWRDDENHDDVVNEDDSDDEDSDLEDIFSSHLSCLAEVQ